MLAYNGIGASVDGCIIPINLEVMTLRGTKNVIDAVIEIQELFKKAKLVHKGILGMIKSQYVKRSRIQRDFEDVVEDFFPVRAFNTTIPNLTACDKAHARGMLFAQFEKKAYEAFDSLVNEIIATDIIRNNEKETIITNNIDKEISEKLYNN
jgi:cellulose biosynthesis protein BcsQ